MNTVMSVEQYLARFNTFDPAQVTHIDIGGPQPVAVRASPSPGAKAVVFLFHGAVDQYKREIPAFFAYREGIQKHAHQVALFDPSLTLAKDLKNAWYVGSATMPLQKLLPPFFERISQHLDVSRTVFSGSSGGGFASLYYSSVMAGSVATVFAPQTNIDAYYSPARDDYLQTCWPSYSELSQTGINYDMTAQYASGLKNTVVYVHSVLDDFHLRAHMIPFLSSVPMHHRHKVALRCSYWGRAGHSGAVPSEEMDAWVKAVLSAETTSVPDIVEEYELARRSKAIEQQSSAQKKSSQSPSAIDARDIELTTRISQTILNGENALA